MKHIIAPVDFSDASFNSAKYAAALANVYGAELILLHAYTNPGSIDSLPVKIGDNDHRTLPVILTSLIKEKADILRKQYTVPIHTVLQEGDTVGAIESTAAKYDRPLIVMGAKGKGKSNSIFGSTTSFFIQWAQHGVLTVPEWCTFNSFENLTLAIDLDAQTRPGIFELIRQLCVPFDPFISLLYVSHDKRETTAPRSLQTMIASKALSHIRHGFFIINDDDVDDGIEDFLEKHPSDLLVMFSRKRNIFQRIFQSSKSYEMAGKSKIPLLVLPG